VRAFIDNRSRCDKDAPLVTWRIQKYDGQPIEVIDVSPAHKVRRGCEFARFDLDALWPLTRWVSEDVVPKVVYRGSESRDAGSGKSIQDQRFGGIALLTFANVGCRLDIVIYVGDPWRILVDCEFYSTRSTNGGGERVFIQVEQRRNSLVRN
jgi:hypothetical protein